MDTQGIEQMLSVLRSTAAQAAGGSAQSASGAQSAGAEFSQILKSTIDKVDATKKKADKMAEDFVAGESKENLHEVMVALQTASVSFQEMVQVRNRLVTAYQDIMNMQV